MAALVEFVVAVVLGTVFLLTGGFTLHFTWLWFVVPLIANPQSLSVLHAMGLLTVSGVILLPVLYHASLRGKETSGLMDLGMMSGLCAIEFVYAAVVHFFML